MARKHTAIDLFCGVGGMSLGFEQAGFDVLAAFDKEEFNVKTHKKNFPKTRCFQADLSTQSGESLRKMAKLGRRQIDVVFGGPPCQGFSVGGRQDSSDKRNLLVYEFSRLVRELRPKYFVFENVKGLMQKRSEPVLSSLLRRFRRSGYKIVEPVQVLNAADYGVPQRRERVFILGFLEGQLAPLYPEPEGCFDEAGRQTYPTIRDAISDLPSFDGNDELFESDTFEAEYKKTNSAFALSMRGELIQPNVIYDRDVDTITELSGCLLTRHSKAVVDRFSATPQGEAEAISRYYRLCWENVSPTLRAGTGEEHGSHTAPRPIHPNSPRCITTREAARIHSYPDWFQFYGTRWHDFRQIGNSVPPALARAVALVIMDAIKSHSK